MNRHTFRINVSYAFGSQLATLILSACTSILIPRFLDVESFGYIQLFLFYSSYASLFQLGLSEGIYLRFGGISYKKLSNENISSQLYLISIFLGIVSILILILGYIFLDSAERLFVVSCFAIYTVLFGCSYFFGYIFQATNKIKEYALAIVFEKLIAMIGVVFCLFLQIELCYPYIWSFIIGKIISCIYCIIIGREALFIKPALLRMVFNETFSNICCGIKLVVANTTGLFVIGVVRLFVDTNFGIEEFSQISLAISLTNIFLAFISQIGTVLFPTLKQLEESSLKKFYHYARDSIGFIFPFILICFVPLKYILSIWLPEYQSALLYLGVLLPICYFDGKTNLLFNTYMKVYRHETSLMTINILSVAFSALLSFLSAVIFHQMLFLLIGALIAVISRNLALEIYVGRFMQFLSAKQFMLEIMLTSSFVFAFLIFDELVSLSILIMISTIYLTINIQAYKKAFNYILRRD
jgi:O-antigen/teichoic acid export membrane protein